MPRKHLHPTDMTGMKDLLRRKWLKLDYGLRLYACNLAGSIPSFRIRQLVYSRLGRVRIGSKTSVHRGLRLFCLGGISLGEGSVVNGECWLDGRMGLSVGNHVSISIGARLLTLGHDPQSPNFSPLGAPIVVEDYAWIGAFATLLPGVRIGKGAVVGAGSVVTRDVAAYVIVAGSPARPVGERQKELNYVLDHAPLFF